jgi:transposase
MRGDDLKQMPMFSYVSQEERIPSGHPLRRIRGIVDRVLKRLSPRFAELYSDTGRPSIAPERLLRALLLQVLYTIRSERLLMEQLEYNLLFRWFVGLSMDDEVWTPTVFTKNRDRLAKGDLAAAFFEEVVTIAREEKLMSDEHFTVDGTLIEAWASQKSFQKKDGPPQASGDDLSNPTVNFHGEKRSNDTHASTTDPEARLYRKGSGKEAKLSYMGHVLMDNRYGLATTALVTTASGTAEREAGVSMLNMTEEDTHHHRTVGGDKNYDTASFVKDLREIRVTPHVAQNLSGRHSAIDHRTTRHPGYEISQQRRKRVEEIFGWVKTIGLMRKVRHRGKELVGWIFTFTTAIYNVLRISNLKEAGVCP